MHLGAGNCHSDLEPIRQLPTHRGLLTARIHSLVADIQRMDHHAGTVDSWNVTELLGHVERCSPNHDLPLPQRVARLHPVVRIVLRVWLEPVGA